MARYHAGKGEFEEAWQIVRRYAQPPVLPGATAGVSIPQLEQKLYANPADYADGYALYRAQMAPARPMMRSPPPAILPRALARLPISIFWKPKPGPESKTGNAAGSPGNNIAGPTKGDRARPGCN